MIPGTLHVVTHVDFVPILQLWEKAKELTRNTQLRMRRWRLDTGGLAPQSTNWKNHKVKGLFGRVWEMFSLGTGTEKIEMESK